MISLEGLRFNYERIFSCRGALPSESYSFDNYFRLYLLLVMQLCSWSGWFMLVFGNPKKCLIPGTYDVKESARTSKNL